MESVAEALNSNRPSFAAIALGFLASFAIFLAIGATQLEQELPEVPEEQPISYFYTPPPPPPPKQSPPERQERPEIDFSIPIDPAPFELSLDFLSVRIGARESEFEPVAFDLEESIDSFRTQGLERLRVYEAEQVDEPPVALKRFAPRMPDYLKYAILNAVVQYRVTAEGKVENIVILSTNLPELNQRIISTVTRWRFKPAMKSGEPVHSWVRHSIAINTESPNNNPISLD